MRVREIFAKQFLLETELTKGAKFVLSDKKVVANVADMLKNDVTVPREQRLAFRRMKDIDVATWFVQRLDDMERQGLGGVIFSRDGKNHFWIAKSYGNGGELWEDIAGEYPEAMRDYMILKNRNMLDPKHQDVQKFRGVKDLHRYMVIHYEKLLDNLRKDAELGSLIKNKRSIRIVDNDDYSIYLLQNRGAACAFGKGATYCTANSRDSSMWNMYSKKAAIFGMVPKVQEKVSGTSENPDHRHTPIIGVDEKYQFDAGSHSFRNPLDKQVDAAMVTKKWPYMFTDIVKGLKEHKKDIEDPEIEPGVDKVKYNINTEISLLKSNLSQYWTDKVRPKPAADGETVDQPANGQPIVGQSVPGAEPNEEPIVAHQVPRDIPPQ